MKKYARRWSGLILAALCLVMTVSAGAVTMPEAERMEPRYVTLTDFEAELSIGSGGRSTCTGTVRLRSGYNADVTMELQQKDGSRWETIQDWSDSGRRVTLNHSWYVESGYDYRVKLSAEVTDSNGRVVEQPVTYSSVESY